MSTLPHEHNDEPRLIGSSGASSPIEPKYAATQRRSFFRSVGTFLGLCRDYSVADIGRLKEAGVRVVEAKADDGAAVVVARLAAAAESHARAEVSKQNAATARIKVIAESKAKLIEAESIRLTAMAEAMSTLKSVISEIRQSGGEVAFNEDELMRLLCAGREDFPDDRIIEQAEQDNLQPETGAARVQA